MKNTFKKHIGRTLSIFLAIFLLLGTIPIFGVSAAEVTSNFEYTLLDDGTIEVTKYVGTDLNVVIPKEIDKKNVSSVSSNCFAKIGCEVESIFIPKTIKSLGEYQMEGAPKISLTTFITLSNLKSINVDSENEYYSSIDGVLFDKKAEMLLFYPRSKECTEYSVPSSVKNISSYSFSEVLFLKSLKFSNKLENIGGMAFSYMYGLEEIYYPSYNNKDQLYDKIFSSCSNLNKVFISKEINNICSEDFDQSTNVTLYVYNNSYALDWAKEHGFAYEIMEEPPIEKDLVDESTGIKVKGTMDPDATLNVEKVESTVEDAVATYDITLRKDGDVIQPSGTITISIPSEIKDCKLFWVKDDGTKVEVNAIYENGKYVFTTDHLSVYALVKEPESTTVAPPETTVPEPTATEPIETTVPEPTATEPIETTVPEPTVTEPIETTVPEPTATEPIETTVPVPTVTEPIETTVPEPTVTEPIETTVPEPTATEPVETTVPVPTVTEQVETTVAPPETTVESATDKVEPTKSVATPDTPNNNSNSGSSSGSSSASINNSSIVATGDMLGASNLLLLSIIIMSATTGVSVILFRRKKEKVSNK